MILLMSLSVRDTCKKNPAEVFETSKNILAITKMPQKNFEGANNTLARSPTLDSFHFTLLY